MDPIEASQLITDEYAAKILVATYSKARDALDLSRNLGIPIAACYRRIHSLEDAGLLHCEETVMGEMGKAVRRYRSNLKNAYIFFERGKLKVKFQLISGECANFGTEWTGEELLQR